MITKCIPNRPCTNLDCLRHKIHKTTSYWQDFSATCGEYKHDMTDKEKEIAKLRKRIAELEQSN